MKKYKWYRWTWTDGTVTICRNYDRHEKMVMESKHGKLISKVYEGTY